jgi:transaldolase
MKFFRDSANLDEIHPGGSPGVIDGIIINPTLIAKEKRAPRRATFLIRPRRALQSIESL